MLNSSGMLTASIIISWILAAPLFFLGVVSIGFVVTGWIFREPTRAFRLAASPILGAAIASVWLDLAARGISWEFATVTLWLIGAAAFLFVGKNFFRSWRLGWVLAAVVLLTFSLVGGVMDDAGHFAMQAIMANGVWPVPDFFSPDRPLLYHYGFDILAAALARFGWPVPFAADVLTATLQLGLLALVWQMMKQQLRGRALAILGTALALGAGTLGWIVRPLRGWLGELLGSIYPFMGSFFTNPLFARMYSRAPQIATGLAIMGLLVVLGKIPVRKGRLLWLLPFFIAAVGLSDETYLFTVVPFALGGFLLACDSWRMRGYAALAALSGLALVMSRAGIVRDVVLRFFGAGGEFGVGYSFVALRTTLLWQTMGADIDLHRLEGILRIFLELAAPIALLVFAFFMVRRLKSRVISGVYLGAVIAWMVPIVLIYPAYQNQINRFWVPAMAIMGPLGAIMMLQMVKRRGTQIFLTALMTFGGVANLFLINVVPTYWAANPEPAIYYPALWGAFFNPATRLPPGSVVWTDAPRTPRRVPAEFQTMPLVFGVPVAACYDILIDTTSSVCDDFWDEPNQDTLRALGATHLALTEAYWQEHRQDAWFRNLIFLKRFDPPSWSRRLPRAWWENRETPLYLYQVDTQD